MAEYAEIAEIIRKKQVTFEGGGNKHVILNELSVKDMWDTLEKGIFVTGKQLLGRFPEKELSYKWPYYFLHRIRNLLTAKYVLLGFYVTDGSLKIRHFSQCSAEVKFYHELRKSLQDLSSKN